MYEVHYGLTAKPFQLRPDPRFFFGSRNHKRAMAYLEYGLSQGEGFIVITGEVGAGKTTLVRNLFEKLDPSQIVAAQIVNTHLSSDDTLKMVAAAFGLPVHDSSKAGLLTEIERFLRNCSQLGKRALLVVDEAQNLSPQTVEELRMLSNFQTNDSSLLQTFLLGQPEFRTTLMRDSMRQLRQRVIATYHLGPMDSDETQIYIEHRLQTAGWTGNPTFTDAAFVAIHEQTGGIPRRINTFCDRLLLMGYLEELNAFDAPHIATVAKDIQDEFAQEPGVQHDPAVPLRTAAAHLEGQHASLESIQDRLSRIERAMQSMIDALAKLLHVSQTKNSEKDINP